MKVLVTGSEGQLGRDLCLALGAEVVPLGHRALDITKLDSVLEAICRHRPDVVVNAAAYVRVDDCESHADEAFAVNALGARNVAVAAERNGSKLIYVSTDYVFGDELQRLTPYTEFDTPAPLNVYGRSKLAGEEFVRHLCHRHFVVRSSSLFGVSGSTGKMGNFVETILGRAKRNEVLRVVNDQVFSPTFTRDLAGVLSWLLTTEYYGTFHVTNQGSCSWYEFARTALDLTGTKATLVPISSAELAAPTQRPRFSVLDNYQMRLLGVTPLRPWPEALRDYLERKGHLPVDRGLAGDAGRSPNVY